MSAYFSALEGASKQFSFFVVGVGGGRCVFPSENLSLFQAEIREFSHPISQFSVWNAAIKSRQEPIPTFSFKPCLKRARNLTLFQAQTVAVHTHFHTKTFSFQKKKTTKIKKKLFGAPKKDHPPPPPPTSGPPKLLKYSKLKRRTRFAPVLVVIWLVFLPPGVYVFSNC